MQRTLRGLLVLALVHLPVHPARAQGGDSETPVAAGPEGRQELFAPTFRDGFAFAVFGDRTGGPAEGLEVLRRAVAETNLFDPDFVMTVGDLINGYNREDEWLAQMKEYKAIMNGLAMPWFPVAGNHDVYGLRGERSDRGNLGRYLDHFGPLWYSFDHGDAHFVVLFSDEDLAFRDPARTQNMSPEQLEWLRADLKATRATSIFLFLHHPRWTRYYRGSNWREVHALLEADGRVRAVFGGHIHRYRYDEIGKIRYYTLATTGGHKGDLEEAGQLHHFNLVTVRGTDFRVAVVPVGQVRAGEFVHGDESEDVAALDASGLGRFASDLLGDGQAARRAVYWVKNPTSRPVEYRFALGSAPARVETLPPRGVLELPLDYAPGELPALSVEARYRLESGRVQPIRAQKSPIVRGLAPPPATDGVDRCLALDGVDDCVRLPHSAELVPTGPFTLEMWMRPAPESAPRSALAAKTESSAYGLFFDEEGKGEMVFWVHAAGRGYAGARAPRALPGVWTHVAGTWDGKTIRLFVDGKPGGSVVHPGDLTPNELPLLVGADPGRTGEPTSVFHGEIDEIRLSSVARYQEAFEPARRHEADERTILLLHLDEPEGPVAGDATGRGHHGVLLGEPKRVRRD